MSFAPNIFLSAGEASGEHYGAALIPALRALYTDASFFGLGGQRMQALGMERIVRAEDVAVMGITEVVRHLPRIYGEYLKLKRSIIERKPDLAILIDFPDVNLSLARTLHEQGTPVLYFVSPQLWAWKKYRIRKVQRYVDRMLVIFPFEEAFYQGHGVQADFVGHPLTEVPLPTITRAEFAAAHHLDPAKHWVGLLPGSRGKEIRLNLPEMIAAAKQLGNEHEYVLPLAPTLTEAQREHVRQMLAALTASAKDLSITVVNDARATLMHARASIVASGTATVEAALIGNPFVVVYRVSPLSYAIARRVVTVPHVAMANLIADRRVVPELIQQDFTAANIVREMQPLVANDRARAQMMAGLAEIRAKLSTPGSSAIARVTKVAHEMLQRRAALSRVG
uniref:Lipid-A-disaccharide synthase n=1 Tax=Acidobacterium capsulatum TaxID=33075 RepID=A0A7V5CU35_9BACT